MVVIYGHLLLIFMPLIVCIIFAIGAFICNILLIMVQNKIKKIDKEIEEIDKQIRDLEQKRKIKSGLTSSRN